MLIEELKEVLRLIKEIFDFHGDMGIEVHPRDVNQQLLSCLKDLGITQISLGVQTL